MASLSQLGEELAKARYYSYLLSTETFEAKVSRIVGQGLDGNAAQAIEETRRTHVRNKETGINKIFGRLASALYGPDASEVAERFRANERAFKYLVCLSHCICEDHLFLVEEVVPQLFEDPVVYTGLDVLPTCDHFPQVHLLQPRADADKAYEFIYTNFFAEFKFASLCTCVMLKHHHKIYKHFKRAWERGTIDFPSHSAFHNLRRIFRRMYHLVFKRKALREFIDEFLKWHVPGRNIARNSMTMWYFWKVVVLASERSGERFVEALKVFSDEDPFALHAFEHDNIAYVPSYLRTSDPFYLEHESIGVCLDGKIDPASYETHVLRIQEDNKQFLLENGLQQEDLEPVAQNGTAGPPGSVGRLNDEEGSDVTAEDPCNNDNDDTTSTEIETIEETETSTQNPILAQIPSQHPRRTPGRPPKEDVLKAPVSLVQGKKRGRPPKDKAETVPASPPQAKKRGRPPKEKAETVPASPPQAKIPGRAPNKENGEAAPVSPPQEKKRGRPPKDKAETVGAIPPQGKKRGRPPKDTAEIMPASPRQVKKRGRPCKKDTGSAPGNAGTTVGNARKGHSGIELHKADVIPDNEEPIYVLCHNKRCFVMGHELSYITVHRILQKESKLKALSAHARIHNGKFSSDPSRLGKRVLMKYLTGEKDNQTLDDIIANRHEWLMPEDITMCEGHEAIRFTVPRGEGMGPLTQEYVDDFVSTDRMAKKRKGPKSKHELAYSLLDHFESTENFF